MIVRPEDCEENEQFLDGSCLCDELSVRLDSGICFRCVPGSFKSNNVCMPCVIDCISCDNATSCN